jgi:small subunit ribosomal protein S20
MDAYKGAIKSFKKLIMEKKPDAAKAALSGVYQALDKAAKSGVIKANKASRLKSRLAIRLSPPSPQTPS